MENYSLELKRGALKFEISRNELISSSETPDGITFKFKGGVTISIDDPVMPQDVKQRVCLADIGFKKGNLIFDLNNYRNPVSISNI